VPAVQPTAGIKAVAEPFQYRGANVVNNSKNKLRPRHNLGEIEGSGPPAFSSGAARAEALYAECLRLLSEAGIPFVVGGTLAVSACTGLPPPEKDVDVFCKAGDYPRILGHFRRFGYDAEVEDERWIAKIKRGDLFLDVIFNSTIAIVPVTAEWFKRAVKADVNGLTVPLLSPTELIWSKAFVQDRQRYDGADIAHVILKQCENIDWRRLL